MELRFQAAAGGADDDVDAGEGGGGAEHGRAGQRGRAGAEEVDGGGGIALGAPGEIGAGKADVGAASAAEEMDSFGIEGGAVGRCDGPETARLALGQEPRGEIGGGGGKEGRDQAGEDKKPSEQPNSPH